MSNKKITGSDGERVAIEIVDIYTRKKNDGTGVVVVIGRDEEERTGEDWLSLSPSLAKYGDKTISQYTQTIQLLSEHGLEDTADLRDLESLVGCPGVFKLSSKDDGKVFCNLQFQSKRIEGDDRVAMMREIRGQSAINEAAAKAQEAALNGEPVSGDENMPW